MASEAPAEPQRHTVHHVSVSKRGTILVAFAPCESSESGFERFAKSEALVPFMREALEVVETELSLTSYHLRVLPWSGVTSDESLALLLFASGAEAVAQKGEQMGFVLYVAGSNAVVRYIPVIGNLDDLDAPISYQDAEGKEVEVPGLTLRSVLVRGEEPEALIRSNLDFQGRSCYVLVMAPNAPSAQSAAAKGEVVRRQAELSDPELAALWRTAAMMAEDHGGFEEMHLNAGNFQNVAHMHLKVWIPRDLFRNLWAEQEVYEKLQAAKRWRDDAWIRQQEEDEMAKAIAMSLEQ